MALNIFRNRLFFFGFFILLFMFSLPTYAGNPASPFTTTQNVLDPGNPNSAWGGCGPSDSNCYVTIFGQAANFTTLTMTTSITDPLLVGGTTASSSLSLQSTSGVGSADFIKFLVGNNGATEAMRVITNGNVGIGDPTPASKLEVTGDIRISTGSGGSLIFADGTSINTSSVPGSAGSVANVSDAIITGDSDISGAGGIILRTGATDRLTILNGGSVGINDTTPDFLLDVAGTLGVDGAATLASTLSVGAITSSGALALGSNTITSGLINGQTISSSANFTGTLSTSGNITSGGYIDGIAWRLSGTTTDGVATRGIQTDTTTTGLRVNAQSGGVVRLSVQAVDTATFAAGTGTVAFAGGAVSGITTLATTGAVTITDSTNNPLTINSTATTGAGIRFQQNGTQFAKLTTVSQLAGSGTDFTPVLFAETGLGLKFVVNGSSTAVMTILSGGNVGIGTTGPGFKLDVNTASADGIRTTSASQTVLRLDTTNPDSAARNYQIAISSVVHGDFNITQSTTRGGDPINATSRFYINPTGNVGIGTTGPLSKLHVSGTSLTSFTDNTNKSIAVLEGDAYTAGDVIALDFRPSDAGYKSLARIALRTQSAGSYLDFGTSNTYTTGITNTAMTIDYNGNVGIGTTGPGSRLDIAFGGYTSSGDALRIGADIGNNTTRTNATAKLGLVSLPHYTNAEEPFALLYGYSSATTNELVFGGAVTAYNTATDIVFYTAANNTTVVGTERMRIDKNGNVGIGVTNPQSKLHLLGANASALAPFTGTGFGNIPNITIANSNGTVNNFAGMAFSYDETGSASAGIVTQIVSHSTGEGNLLFGTTNSGGTLAERMRISSAGNVGIGVTNPGNPLEVRFATAAVTGVTLSNLAAAGTGFNFLDGVANSALQFRVKGNGDVINTNNSYGAISDIQLKENVSTAGDFLNSLNSIRIINYSLISEHLSQANQIGVIAQELEPIFPNFVDTGTDGFKSVAYSKFVPILIKGVQELDAKVNLLEQNQNILQDLDLNMEAIAGIGIPTPESESFATSFFSNLFTRLIAWFGDTANGIVKIFTGEIDTKSLCVSDDSGAKTCLNKSQLDALLVGAGSPQGGGGENPPSPESCSDGIQNQNETGVDTGGVCTPPETPAEEPPQNP